METIDNQVLRTALGGETAEFTVKASRTCLPSQTIGLFLMGIVFFFLGCVMTLPVLIPLLLGSVAQSSAGYYARFVPLLVLVPVAGLFALGGLFIIGVGLYRLLAPGSWFVGTPTRLLMIRKNRQKSVGWNEFSGEIETRIAGEKGAIILTMLSQRMVRRGRYGSAMVPRKITLVGIDDAMRIEQIIRKRISPESRS